MTRSCEKVRQKERFWEGEVLKGRRDTSGECGSSLTYCGRIDWVAFRSDDKHPRIRSGLVSLQ